MISETALMKYCWIIILWSLTAFSAIAQRMCVEDFGRYKKPFLRKAVFATDKRHALLDFFTNEKGFQFFACNVAVSATEGDGVVTLSLPHRTESLLIKHPKYGDLVWKVPDGVLKKKRRYHAYLHTESLDKEFRQEKQWALFSTDPAHAIVYIDSLIYPVLEGHLSLYLPLGKHTCRIESPFYQTLNDTIELIDSVRFEKQYILQPFYAYLSVETDWSDAKIYLDGSLIGMQRAETARLMPGRYRLTVNRSDSLYYERWVELANAERKVVNLNGVELYPLKQWDLNSGTILAGETSPDTRVDSVSVSEKLSDVYIKAFDSDTEIWLNRERVGRGEWRGKLSPGFYAVSSKKEGLDSRTDFFWVEASKTVELNLISPLADYGLLNISCDEVDALVFLNGVMVGVAPCVLHNLPVDNTYRLRLVKGHKKAEKVIRLKGNDIVNVQLKLK
ncbi:PEGA domain-containing protein [Bacteroides mediterraneensis]|uniref:PEGA domain-containing protein n=1 Tax=Bacteroides mediterraneensis TaxID=1841856 RepID=A0ABS2EWC5_9BACE|nr:PEGA domain-containing protein [Bacteroides mediterraneensis]MBM6758861.1 PEGA domain-containing protein [Bacteroides mediterraneensis]MBM6782028.1 PEGA domain-containing protein [Bacteroides mediterraneensis]